MNYRFSSWTTVYRGLMGAFGDGRHHLDSEVADFEQDEHRVLVRFADGSSRTLDVLVCADGISSTARTRLLPDARARYAGYVARRRRRRTIRPRSRGGGAGRDGWMGSGRGSPTPARRPTGA